MEPASTLIDEASDLAADGKVDESIAAYRKALVELDRVEAENPERAKSAEFATLRNKRAYVNAAIDTMLLSQVKANARAVAVSDTTELERRLAAERAAKRGEKPPVPAPTPAAEEPKPQPSPASTPQPLNASTRQPLSKRALAMESIAKGDYATAERLIDELLVARPNGAAALNLRAALETRQGRFKDAERTLDQAIMSNPRNHFAYYNMARLVLQSDPEGKATAKRYYETGRALGGPVDERLEVEFR